MSRTIDIRSYDPAAYSADQNYWVYNGLDCIVTLDVYKALLPQANHAAHLIYRFEQAMNGPGMEMSARGFLIDQTLRENLLVEFYRQLNWLKDKIRQIGAVTWGKDLNPASPPQVQKYFYDYFGIPKIYNNKNGQRSVSTDRKALEKIAAYYYARPMAKLVMSYRDVAKKISTLKTPIDSDGRMRASYNTSATETGRWSSSSNVFGTGTNLQNQTDELKGIFVADEGKKLAYVDLEQAESRAVGLIIFAIFGDSTYLDACESGDLHTTVCKMVWDDLPWTGDLSEDKATAKKPFYRHFSYRDMAKRGGHGTNYAGQPPTMARNLNVEQALMERFQDRYFAAFPGIPKWHTWVREQVQLHARIMTPLGRERYFFGRGRDDSTIREAIAFMPQSTVGDILNLGLWRLWKYLGHRVQVIGQVHDAVVFQYDPAEEATIIPEALRLIEAPITMGGRTMTIPTECEVGWNWQHASEKNADGLKALTPGQLDPRTRQRPAYDPTKGGMQLLKSMVS